MSAPALFPRHIAVLILVLLACAFAVPATPVPPRLAAHRAATLPAEGELA